MSKKPTYEELEHRVKELEKESVDRKRIEKRLEEKEQTLKALLNAPPETAILVDLEGTTLAINEIAVKRVGKNLDELIGLNLFEYLPHDVAASRKAKGDEVVRSGKPVRFQDEREGRFYDNNIYPVFDAEGKVTTLAIYARDITETKRAEEALREGEEKYRNLVERANDGVVIVQDGTMKFANNRIAGLFGYNIDEMHNTPFLDYVFPDERIRIKELHERRIKDEDVPDIYEMQGLHKDGRKIDIEANSGIITYHGKPAVLAFIRDITGRKQAEEALRVSEIKFRTLAEFSPTAISIIRGDHFLYVNSAWENLTGYSKDEARSLNPSLVAHPDMRELVIKRAADRVKGEQAPPRYEMKGITKSGGVKWFDFSATTMEYDGEPAILAVANDITERKLAEETLHESEERYRSLFKNNHSVMLLIDPENANIVDANPAAISYYGWSQKELTSKKIADINTLTEEQIFQEMEKAKLEQRRHFIFRHRLSNRDIRDVEVYSGPIKLHGQDLLYSIIHDITDRKQVEEEREKLINELQEAIKEIKTLRGILPLCSYCKKIRDDKGYWEQVDVYIHKHSQADISHGICPDCSKEHYPDVELIDD